MKVALGVLVAVVTVLVLGAGALVVSRLQADSACTAYAERHGYSSIGYESSLLPPGVTCTYDGGSYSRTAFWH